MEGFLLLIITIVVIYYLCKDHKEKTLNDTANAPSENIICPHCQTKGHVVTKQVKQKAGIHGGKATAAILTCGISLFGTGLSRKQMITEAHCNNCGQKWQY